ncbi:putative phage terminase large subunit-like protein [Chelatococcus caeni]|uniref:Putative phage terminase large subunit-like protein n=1 Tax=Chelatococcus caeni TaxID=1348468 RepID=A0A840C5B0_9HYPH|nr:phage terminase large subunit [Chelatococcus caeni]MBB4017587.1 putative phage terminase large subunit-like protein [Chelatococcus caeni]
MSDDFRIKEQLLKATRREIAIREGRDDLLRYMQLTMPDPEDPEDADRSAYIVTPQARMLCQIVEKVYAGEIPRAAVSIGPQLGKSQILTRAGPAWMSGKNPRMNVMVGAYNQDFANDFGNDVKTIVESPVHSQVFPGYGLMKSAVDQLITHRGGKLSFVGVGGSGTGKPADLFIVDDPIRNDDDAQSETYREKVWKWFTSVAFSRARTGFRTIVVHTRWHEDDLIGRLCDPDHPERNKRFKGIADNWRYYNLPAVVDDPKLANALGLTLEPQSDKLIVSMFGTKPIAALAPEMKDLRLLAEAKNLDSRTFGALYMGRPAPEDGDYFKEADLVPYYSEDELPLVLEVFGASDHAVSEKQRADYTVLGCVGVDSRGDIWVLPDLVWERMETDDTVEALLNLFKTRKPLLWWMESDLISKSFGPFLYKRMEEENVYCTIDPVTVSQDKRKRARAIQGLMRRKKVHFPAFASWWPQAKQQLLKFPYATHDDFVDWLAHIGLGRVKETEPSEARKAANSNEPPSGSIAWVLRQTEQAERAAKRRAATAGW